MSDMSLNERLKPLSCLNSLSMYTHKERLNWDWDTEFSNLRVTKLTNRPRQIATTILFFFLKSSAA